MNLPQKLETRAIRCETLVEKLQSRNETETAAANTVSAPKEAKVQESPCAPASEATLKPVPRLPVVLSSLLPASPFSADSLLADLGRIFSALENTAALPPVLVHCLCLEPGVQRTLIETLTICLSVCSENVTQQHPSRALFSSKASIPEAMPWNNKGASEKADAEAPGHFSYNQCRG